ncbi:MAG: DUF86 domain-containing protein [Pseudomonadota bacterium]
MVVTEIVESRLKLLEEYRNDLREYESMELADYRRDKKTQRFVERTLQLAIEACIDIASHIVSAEGFREAKDNKDLFVILSEQGILSTELLPAMMDMCKFRNIIVHDYTRIDPEIVIGILRRNLKDFDSFSKEIGKYIYAA